MKRKRTLSDDGYRSKKRKKDALIDLFHWLREGEHRASAKKFTLKQLSQKYQEHYGPIKAIKKSKLIDLFLEDFLDPFRFLMDGISSAKPLMKFESLFERGYCGSTLKFRPTMEGYFWQARSFSKSERWWANPNKDTLSATVHFVSGEGGTGVHFGNGLILTCAHVLSYIQDDENGIPESRIGRKKMVIFPSRKCFETECVKCLESEDGKHDLAIVKILRGNAKSPGFENLVAALPSVSVSELPPSKHDKIYCIGYPNDRNLESNKDRTNCFEPRGWYLSCGNYKGDSSKDGLGGFMHSCWTYWGHSGAPIFNQNGQLVALHNSWDDLNGMRHGIGHAQISSFLQGIDDL